MIQEHKQQVNARRRYAPSVITRTTSVCALGGIGQFGIGWSSGLEGVRKYETNVAVEILYMLGEKDRKGGG